MNQDVIDTLGAVRREVKACERDGRPARAVIAERTYDTSVADVWDALTNAERLPRWFAPVTGDLRLGGRYQIEGNAGGEVVACDAPTHLALTWEFGGGTSWLDVVLTEAGDAGTLLRLEHVAPLHDPGAPQGPDMWDQFGPGAVGIGWDLSLLGLGEHLRTGEDVAAAGEAALLGEDGPAYMAVAGDGWYAAEVASGTCEDDARGRADRTVAFYSGEGPGVEDLMAGHEGGEGGGEGDAPG